MSQRTEKFYTEANQLAIGYLIAERIWDPADDA
jgi:hypothetical protein